MKVLYIHQYFSTPQGATGTRSYEFAKALIARGHKVTVLCGSSQLACTGLTSDYVKGVRQGQVEGINVIEFDLSYSNYDNFFKRAAKFLRFSFWAIKETYKNDYDLLFATSTPLTIALPGIVMKFLRLKSKQPFIFEVRDLWPELPAAMGVIKNKFVLAALALLEKLSYRAADVGIGLSPGICKGMTRHHYLSKDSIRMIPNGCDNILFQQDALPTHNEKLNTLLASTKTVIYTGAHGIANGLPIVIEVAKALEERGHSDLQFIFIGDGKVKPSIMSLVEKYKLENCHFFDPLPKLELVYVLQHATVGLMTLQNVEAFYYGTSPNKFSDYIASGLPVINNYPGWLADLIQEYGCGLVCTPNNVESFMGAIVQIYKMENRDYMHMKQQAMKLSLKFDRDVLCKEFVAICENTFETFCSKQAKTEALK